MESNTIDGSAPSFMVTFLHLTFENVSFRLRIASLKHKPMRTIQRLDH